MRLVALCTVLFPAFLTACTPPGGRLTVTPGTALGELPLVLAVHPLLTSESQQRRQQPRYNPMGLKQEAEAVYLEPPAETSLRETLDSRMLTDQLSAALAHRGFRLKELPVQAVAGSAEDDGDPAFGISLELLRRLRRDFGLEAVLVGNAYFRQSPDHPAGPLVQAVYLKLVDTETLDILCHLSIPAEGYGSTLPDVAARMAEELAALAGLNAPRD